MPAPASVRGALPGIVGSMDPFRHVLRRLRSVELKLDVLIDAQGLQAELDEREQADRAERKLKAEQRDEQFRRSSGR
jgi:hypothetical protein